MSILGHRVLRREDPDLLTVGGTYVDDLDLPDAAHVTYVRSTIAHARLLSVDTTEAQGAPGVLAVITSADIELPDLPASTGRSGAAMRRPLLARDVVRFVGEPIAAVVTEERDQGPDAAELVVIDYDPLPAVVHPGDAVASETLLFPEAGTNVCMTLDPRELTADFTGCEVVIEQALMNQRVAACPIEPRVGAAWWDADGRLVQHASCQGAHPIRDELARLYGLETDRVRVVSRDVGGGFGAKAQVSAEGLLLGLLAQRVERPVRWSETRTENMTAMGHGRAQQQRVTIGGTRDGRITAYRLEVLQDAGAYPAIGAVLPWMTRMMLTGVYDIENVEFRSTSVVTNTTPIVAYRGAGRPEAAAAIERAVDLFAAEVGLDPTEVRRRNVIAADAFPFETATGTCYDSGAYEAALDLVLDGADYPSLRAAQRGRRESGDRRQLGIGVSCYVEITALDAGGEYGSVELRADGTVLVKTGSSPYGQGHHTTWAMLVSDRLGVPLDRIEVIHGDTDVIPSGSVTGGSRSVQIAGSSVHRAAGNLIELARERAADLLEAAVDDIVLDEQAGVFHVAGTPAVTLGWSQVAAAAPEPLVGLSDFKAASPTFPFGAHVAVVEVDLDTGAVALQRLVAVDDAGTIINPLVAEGQVHGGLAQGAAQALLEEVRFDDDGNPLTTNFAEYAVISSAELPSFERIPMETPTPVNELGAKGIGESGTVGSTPAIQNAVVDALAPLGVRHLDMPASPERVWTAIAATETRGRSFA